MQRGLHFSAVILLVALPSCASPTAPVRTGPPARLEVQFDVLTYQGGAERAVRQGATLRTGDHLRFRIRSNATAYVYLVQFDPAGGMSVLFPSAAVGYENRVADGQLVTVPKKGSFRLDAATGEETVYLVAALAPLFDLSRVVKGRGGGEQQAERMRAALAKVALESPTGEERPAAGANGPTAVATSGGEVENDGRDSSPPKDPSSADKTNHRRAPTLVAMGTKRRPARRILRRGMVFDTAGPQGEGLRLAATSGDSVIVYQFTFQHVD
jgi:hypothetical protein